ncbi:MAG: hypothetical protein U0517_03995 [Candidatus Andersenbacteria bacterium]
MAKAKTAKKKSETASAIGVYAKIWIAIEAAVLAKGGTYNDLYSLSETKDATLINKFAELVVTSKNGAKKVADKVVDVMAGYLQRLTVACNFSYVWDGITEARFPMPTKPVSEKLEYVVYSIKQAMNRAEIIAAMAAEGLRPATLYELLVWAAKNPLEGTQYWVVALEQYFTDSGGSLDFAYINPYGYGRRELDYGWINRLSDRWSADGRFLAVRKSSDEPLAT